MADSILVLLRQVIDYGGFRTIKSGMNMFNLATHTAHKVQPNQNYIKTIYLQITNPYLHSIKFSTQNINPPAPILLIGKTESKLIRFPRIDGLYDYNRLIELDSQPMIQTSLGPAPNCSQQKILSTENSRNSTFTNLIDNKEATNQQDSSFRLFTFMNIRNQDLNQEGRASNNNRKKSTKKIVNKGLKRDHSGLISMIQESRKKRENFYKLILDSQSLVSIDNDRKCKTPTNLRQTSNNVSVKCFNSKKFATPKASTNKQYSFFQKEQKPRKKPLESKNSNSEVRLSIKKQEAKQAVKNEKMVGKWDRMEKQQQAALMRKKKELEKQLLEINQTILLGHQKKRSKAPKTRR